MALSQRTILELRCDMAVCTSVIRGQNQHDVMRHAFEVAGWTTTSLQLGHGQVEVIHRCPAHVQGQ